MDMYVVLGKEYSFLALRYLKRNSAQIPILLSFDICNHNNFLLFSPFIRVTSFRSLLCLKLFLCMANEFDKVLDACFDNVLKGTFVTDLFKIYSYIIIALFILGSVHIHDNFEFRGN